MNIKPFLHEHYLLFDCYHNEEARCDQCNQQIDGWAYSYESCPKFWLHSSCAEEQLPSQISHPFHTQHLLTLSTDDFDGVDFICHKCFSLSRGHRYRRTNCNLKVDVSCAASANDATLEKLESKRSDDSSFEFPNFVHEHRLTGIFNYRKVSSEALIPKLREQEDTGKGNAESQSQDLEVEEIAPAEEPSLNLVLDFENTSIQGESGVSTDESTSNLVLDFENISTQAESEMSTDESTEEQQSDEENPAMKE
ncbi:hypothetical protein POUND7_000473 [Theobroma cacao]